MNVYVSNILFAALSFPLIAFFITLPYMIYQYRRFGSIPWLRTLVVYSFAFYLLCAYFLVLLPLPEDRSAVVPYAQTPQLVPFNFVHGFLAETTFSPSDPSTWLAALRDPYVYEAFFNAWTPSSSLSSCRWACTCATISAARGGRRSPSAFW